MKRQQGFTLLEILAAFLVLALVFATVLQLIGGGLRNARRASDFTQAALLANSKMDELGTLIPLEEGALDGEFNDNYRWEIDISLEPIETSGGLSPESYPLDLYRVDLRVFWNEGNARADYTTIRAVNRG
jgi:general secretion pathway protein I